MIKLYLANEFCLVEGGVSLRPTGFRRNTILTLDKVEAFRQEHDNTGVYITAYRYDQANQDEARLYGDFYLDLDTNGLLGNDAEECFNQIRSDALYTIAIFSSIYRVDEEDIHVYFSGKKGLHIVVPAEVLGVTPHKHLNEIYKFLATECHTYCKHKTIDLRIYDRKRMFRLPGSKHNDTGLYKIRLSHDELHNLSFAEIRDLAARPRIWSARPPKHNPLAQRLYKEAVERFTKQKPQFNKDRGELKLDFRPPCIEYILTNPVPQGQRNNTTAVLASYAKQRGLSEEQAAEKLMEWNQEYCSPALSAREIETTVRSIYRGRGIYGCSSLRALSQCQPDKCKFRTGRT